MIAWLLPTSLGSMQLTGAGSLLRMQPAKLLRMDALPPVIGTPLDARNYLRGRLRSGRKLIAQLSSARDVVSTPRPKDPAQRLNHDVFMQFGLASNVLEPLNHAWGTWNATNKRRFLRYFGAAGTTLYGVAPAPPMRHELTAEDLDSLEANIRVRMEELEKVVDGLNPSSATTPIKPKQASLGAKMGKPIHGVFICHASEDKVHVARPLARELKKRGVDVWIDEGEILIGDSLRQKIDEGLTKSDYGVVILSPNFFKKEWPQRELDGLYQREVANGKVVILPVIHKLSIEQLTEHSPLLAGRLGAKWSDGPKKVAEVIMERLGRPSSS